MVSLSRSQSFIFECTAAVGVRRKQHGKIMCASVPMEWTDGRTDGWRTIFQKFENDHSWCDATICYLYSLWLSCVLRSLWRRVDRALLQNIKLLSIIQIEWVCSRNDPFSRFSFYFHFSVRHSIHIAGAYVDRTCFRKYYCGFNWSAPNGTHWSQSMNVWKMMTMSPRRFSKGALHCAGFAPTAIYLFIQHMSLPAGIRRH